MQAKDGAVEASPEEIKAFILPIVLGADLATLTGKDVRLRVHKEPAFASRLPEEARLKKILRRLIGECVKEREMEEVLAETSGNVLPRRKPPSKDKGQGGGSMKAGRQAAHSSGKNASSESHKTGIRKEKAGGDRNATGNGGRVEGEGLVGRASEERLVEKTENLVQRDREEAVDANHVPTKSRRRKKLTDPSSGSGDDSCPSPPRGSSPKEVKRQRIGSKSSASVREKEHAAQRDDDQDSNADSASKKKESVEQVSVASSGSGDDSSPSLEREVGRKPSSDEVKPRRNGRKSSVPVNPKLTKVMRIARDLGLPIPPSRFRCDPSEKLAVARAYLREKGIEEDVLSLSKHEVASWREKLDREKELAALDASNIISSGDGRPRRRAARVAMDAPAFIASSSSSVKRPGKDGEGTEDGEGKGDGSEGSEAASSEGSSEDSGSEFEIESS